jgi:hypothetical protein
VSEGWFTGEEAAAIGRETADEVEEAARTARESPFPPEGLIAELTYA